MANSASVYIHFSGTGIGCPEECAVDRLKGRTIDINLTYADVVRITEALDYLAAELRGMRFPAGDLDELQARLEERLLEAEADGEKRVE